MRRVEEIEMMMMMMMMMRECEGDKCCEMCVQVEIGQRDDDERM